MKEVITWVDYIVLSDKELAKKLNKTSRLGTDAPAGGRKSSVPVELLPK